MNSAMEIHEKSFDLMAESDAVKLRVSKAHNPSKKVVWHWYSDWRQNRFGSWLGSFDALAKNEKSIRDSGTIFRMVRDPFAVLVVTPLMQRSHQLASSSDIVFQLLHATPKITCLLLCWRRLALERFHWPFLSRRTKRNDRMSQHSHYYVNHCLVPLVSFLLSSSGC